EHLPRRRGGSVLRRALRPQGREGRPDTPRTGGHLRLTPGRACSPRPWAPLLACRPSPAREPPAAGPQVCAVATDVLARIGRRAGSAHESGSRDTARCRTGLPWHHGTARCRVEREPTMPDAPLLETGVLVVGAGPTGLMAGLVLHRRGVDSLVIDGKSGPTRE